MRSKGAKEIALSGISSAMAIIAVTAAVFVEPLTITMNVIAGLFIMLPLTKNYWKGSIMSYIVSSIAAFFIGNINSIPFIVFFGVYSIILWALDFKFIQVKQLPLWLIYLISWIIKIAFFQLVIFIVWTFMNVVVIEMNFFGLKITYWLVTVIGTVFCVLYDILMHFVYFYLKKFVDTKIK